MQTKLSGNVDGFLHKQQTVIDVIWVSESILNYAHKAHRSDQTHFLENSAVQYIYLCRILTGHETTTVTEHSNPLHWIVQYPAQNRAINRSIPMSGAFSTEYKKC